MGVLLLRGLVLSSPCPVHFASANPCMGGGVTSRQLKVHRAWLPYVACIGEANGMQLGPWGSRAAGAAAGPTPVVPPSLMTVLKLAADEAIR